MTVVVGTAGHIDHGKTSLLRALTGMDADRLPEERRRGMTIDVGYAHAALDDGVELDFVDVPGHDRLVGNMLVGVGEIDAALLVVAADDGPRAQTLEHLELLDALGIDVGIAVITKIDLLAADDPRRALVADEVRALLARTTLAGSPVIAASSQSGEGIDAVRAALTALRRRLVERGSVERGPDGSLPGGGGGRPAITRLAIDRVFAVRGRGSVVTGTLRGGPLAVGRTVRLEPAGVPLRIREVQVHGARVEVADGGGRVALNVSGVDATDLVRGSVVVVGRGVVATDRVVVAVRPPASLGADRRRRSLVHDETLRFHAGTEQVAARVRRARRDSCVLESGEEVLRLVLERPVALALGDRFVLRRPSPGTTAAGGRVLDTSPPAGISRRRATSARLAALAAARTEADAVAAHVALHGVLAADRAADVAAATGTTAAGSEPAAGAGSDRAPIPLGGWLLAPDVADDLAARALEIIAARHAEEPLAAGVPLGELRTAVARELRSRTTVAPDAAASIAALAIDGLVGGGRLARDGELVRDAARAPGLPPPVLASMARLEAALAVPAPPPLPDAIRAAGCPPEGVRALEAAGRIVRLDTTLAWAGSTYAELTALALRLAATGPLAPAAFRDATGTSRRYSLAILEDLGRRGILMRTAEGHVVGPRAPKR